MKFIVTLDNYTSRPIVADRWQDAVETAVMRRYGKRAFASGGIANMRMGHTYTDIYQSSPAARKWEGASGTWRSPATTRNPTLSLPPPTAIGWHR